jgi:hypothetical protein
MMGAQFLMQLATQPLKDGQAITGIRGMLVGSKALVVSFEPPTAPVEPYEGVITVVAAVHGDPLSDP